MMLPLVATHALVDKAHLGNTGDLKQLRCNHTNFRPPIFRRILWLEYLNLRGCVKLRAAFNPFRWWLVGCQFKV
ncbi:MAG: hypothetical protein KTR21_03700 [Rhodobacteraceae bacterium]|nr:hypothetical protein [Paracoccaceae bacterium]